MPHVRAHIQANVSCSAGWDLGENSPRHSLDTTPVTSGIRTQGQLTHIHLRAVRKIGLAWGKLCSDSGLKGCGHVSSNPTPVWHLRARWRIEGRVTVAIEGRVTIATRVQLLDLANSDDIATEQQRDACVLLQKRHTYLLEGCPGVPVYAAGTDMRQRWDHSACRVYTDTECCAHMGFL